MENGGSRSNSKGKRGRRQSSSSSQGANLRGDKRARANAEEFGQRPEGNNALSGALPTRWRAAARAASPKLSLAFPSCRTHRASPATIDSRPSRALLIRENGLDELSGRRNVFCHFLSMVGLPFSMARRCRRLSAKTAKPPQELRHAWTVLGTRSGWVRQKRVADKPDKQT